MMVANILSELEAREGGVKHEAHLFERFAKIADAALSKPEEFGWEGHKLTKVFNELDHLITLAKKKDLGIANANGHKKHTAGNGTIKEGLAL
jgi:hypothetical protein